MHCYKHTDSLSVSLCSTCKNHICAECSVNVENLYHCKICVAEMLTKARSPQNGTPNPNQYQPHYPPPPPPSSLSHRKSKLLTFVFSLLPGLNYMYLGLMKRGLFFMTFFFALSALIREIRIGMFSFTIFMLMCFCLFDSFRIRRLLRDGFDVPDSIDDVTSFYRNNKKPVLLLLGSLIAFGVLRRSTDFLLGIFLESFVFSAFLGVALNVISFVLWLLAIILVCYIIARIVSRKKDVE